MTDNLDPEDFWGTGGIDHNPEIAMRLGQFLAEFATLEACLIWLLGVILGGRDKEDLAWSILGPIQNVTTRCQVVKDAAAQSVLPGSAKAAITRFVDDILRMNTVRNEYVHAVYETNSRTREVRLTPFALSTSRRKQDAKPVAANDLMVHINIMRSIAHEIMEGWFSDELETVPQSSPEKQQ